MFIWILVAAIGADCPEVDDITVEDNTDHIVPATKYSGCSGLRRVVFSSGITTVGFSAFSRCTSLSVVEFPQTLRLLCADAFFDCKSLERITLPDGLEGIETSCFRKTGLITLEFPLSLKMIGPMTFQENEKLLGISFKNSATQNDHFIIDKNAYLYTSGHKDLISVVNSVTSFEIDSKTHTIRNHAFCFCIGQIDTLTIPDSVEAIEERIIYGCYVKKVIIGSGVRDLGSEAFECASYLTEIEVSTNNNYYETFNGVLYTKGMKTLVVYPEGKTDEGFVVPAATESFALGSFTKMCSTSRLTGFGTEVDSVLVAIDHVLYTKDVSTLVRVPPMYPGPLNIDSRVTCIGKGALYSCSTLEEINIPNGVLRIESHVFYISNLKRITIPNTVQYIGGSAFESSMITTLTVPGSVNTIPPRMCCTCNHLESVVLNEGTTEIMESSFVSCPLLLSITLPQSMVNIGHNAFSQDPITSITLPGKLRTIGDRSFAVCTKLESITIPYSVQYIDTQAFAECLRLKTVIIENCGTRIASSAFHLTNIDTKYCLYTRTFVPNYDRVTNKIIAGCFSYLLFDF